MPSSAQVSALTRLLTLNTRVHELEDLLLRLPVSTDMVLEDEDSLDIEYEQYSNPIADLQQDIDKEVRASLVACWFAMPMELDDFNQV
ncbi:MAG: hypothetical protein OXE17_04450 [Chloroflexi bacterium]|nr:hypothetical protein [Chloroflexota bacterium]